MFKPALREERHRRLKDAIPRDGFPMTGFHRDAPPLVVVFHALDLEAAPARARGWRELRCHAGDLVAVQEPTVAWVRTGVGPEAARQAVRELPDVPIAAALCTGFAGALASRVSPRTIVVADPLLDAEGRHHPTPLAGSLVDAACAAGLPCTRGPLVSTARVLSTPAEKAHLHATLGALAVDMESAFLASALAAKGIPAASARVVLDGVEDEIPSSPRALLRKPGLLVPGLRIAARLRPCARISARLLEAWLVAHFDAPQREGAHDGAGDRKAEHPHGR